MKSYHTIGVDMHRNFMYNESRKSNKGNNMAGIYGSSKEDKHFENKLLRHLESNDFSVNGTVEVEDVQISYHGNDYSVDAIVYFGGGDVDLEITSVYIAGDSDWDLIAIEADKALVKILEGLIRDKAVEEAYTYFQV